MLHFTMKMPFVLMALFGSVMILIVLGLRGVLKKKLPKFVFPVLWCMVMVRLLVPFSLSSPLSLKVPTDSWLDAAVGFTEDFAEKIGMESAVDRVIFQGTGSSETTVEAASGDMEVTYAFAEEDMSRFFQRGVWLPCFYILGLSVTIGVLLMQKYRYSRKLRNSLLLEHNETINTILREMEMGHILVFTNDQIASPLVCGLWAPRIYLPTRMDFQNTELLRHILTHETMHIRRKDNWVKALMLAALVLHWFNPVVWAMAKCLASDLETACDEAVLRRYQDEEQKKSYAFSLLAMAITGNRTSMLYSAFSKTEVERRIQCILQYKKASLLLLSAAVLLTACSVTAFATGVQAPFSSYLTAYCASSNSRWGVRIELTRDIALGKDPQRRAEDIVLDILGEDTSNDPELLEEKIKDALSEEFGVERSAFRFDISLCFTEGERKEEWAFWGLVQEEDGYFSYKGEPVRVFVDELGGYYQSREEGDVDITVQRNRYGDITGVDALYKGDDAFDRRTRQIDRDKSRRYVSEGSAAETTIVEAYEYVTW